MNVLGYLIGDATGDPGSGFFMLAMIGLLLIVGAPCVWAISKDDDDDLVEKAKIPSSISNFEKKNYHAIEAMLVSAGFTNVKCVPLQDLTVGVLKRPGIVDSITINGHEVSSTMGGQKYPKNTPIVISYHSLNR